MFCIFPNSKSEWKKRGNRSEFHSERNYLLQNWYFSCSNVKTKWKTFSLIFVAFSEYQNFHSYLSEIFFCHIFFHEQVLYYLKGLKVLMQQNIKNVDKIYENPN